MQMTGITKRKLGKRRNIMDSMVGRSAVPFELKDTAGTTHELEDNLGRWQLLIFHRHLG